LRCGAIAALLLAVAMFGSASAADYIFESLTVKGSGYRSDEIRGQTAPGNVGQKIAETSSGTGSSYDRFQLEIDAVLNSINYSRDAEFEYFPTIYNNKTYDQKWKDVLCAKNYDAGAQVTEAYTQAEHLQKTTEVIAIGNVSSNYLAAHLNSNVIGKAHIGWASNLNTTDSFGRFLHIGKSTEDLTGVFSIEKFIELLQNSSNSKGAIDWMPCA
jgi:hypothetical protein